MLQPTKTFPTLYGISSKGVTKVWKIAVFQGAHDAMIMVQHGQLGGKIQESPEIIREGKNVGKANETSPFEQAVLEAESKWKKKHDSNYTEQNPETAGAQAAPAPKLLPMLAQKYKDRKHKIVWPAFVQPKLNGVRCLVQRVGDKIIFWSRKAKQYKNLNLFMEQEFLTFMKDGDILDGEVYNHGDVTFQQFMSLIKDEKRPEIEKLKKYVRFHCYDRPTGNGGFKDRFMKWVAPTDLEYFTRVSTFVVNDEEDMKKFHKGFTETKYEGTMVRSGGDEAYRFQYRDNQLQKYKDFEDDEFKIIDVEEGTGKDAGHAILICVTPQGIGGRTGKGDFGVRCEGENAIRQEQWKNRKSYIGKELTVRYQVLSDEFIPIFPVGIAVRDYE